MRIYLGFDNMEIGAMGQKKCSISSRTIMKNFIMEVMSCIHTLLWFCSSTIDSPHPLCVPTIKILQIAGFSWRDGLLEYIISSQLVSFTKTIPCPWQIKRYMENRIHTISHLIHHQLANSNIFMKNRCIKQLSSVLNPWRVRSALENENLRSRPWPIASPQPIQNGSSLSQNGRPRKIFAFTSLSWKKNHSQEKKKDYEPYYAGWIGSVLNSATCKIVLISDFVWQSLPWLAFMPSSKPLRKGKGRWAKKSHKQCLGHVDFIYIFSFGYALTVSS
jgi:hypothetical protein